MTVSAGSSGSASGAALPATLFDAKGDILVGTGNDAADNLPVGNNGDILTADSGGGGGVFGVKWSPAPGGGILATIVDVKGDLIVATAPDTVARKAAGANGTALFANSAQSDGLEWRAIAEADVASLVSDLAGKAASSHTHAESDVTNLVTDLAAKIPKSLVDVKGDLIVATADDTPARIAVGSNGQFLRANTGATPGVDWADPELATWRTIWQTSGSTDTTQVAGTEYLVLGNILAKQAGGNVGTGSSIATPYVWFYASGDYGTPPLGKNLRFRLRVVMGQGGTAPGNTLTYTLRRLTIGAGNVTQGAAVSGSTVTHAGTATNAFVEANSGSFAAPSVDNAVYGITQNIATASPASASEIMCSLQMRFE